MQLRAALSELDTDGSGSLEVAELHSAVQLLKASREAARRAHLYIMILLTLLAVLLAALFGVSFAAAVLAATTKGANGSLQDTNGNTLRVAGSAISSVNLGFQAAGAGARRLAEHSGPVPQEYFAHRRTKMTIQDGNGRRLSVTGPVENPHDVKPLILLATVKGSVAIEVCRFAKEGHFNVVLPSFDPYEDGLERAVASFKVNSMVGCAELDHSFGFAGDFGVVLRLGSEESIFHLDCPGPVTPDSDCSVYRAFLIIQPSSGAPTLDVSFARNETFNITSDGELSVPAGIAVGRRLGPGEWPPSSSIGLDVSESACPTLKDESNWPSRSGYGLDSETAWKNALLNELNVDPNATPAQQARLLCQTSVYCMVGYAVGSGAVFHPSFWTSTASAAEAMGKYIANDFKGTLSLNNQKALWASFKKDNAHKCTTTVSSATCLNMNSILVLKGINDYTCKQWNVQDFKAGAIEIAHSCANSCEMVSRRPCRSLCCALPSRHLHEHSRHFLSLVLPCLFAASVVFQLVAQL